jgi:hypothetical protein
MPCANPSCHCQTAAFDRAGRKFCSEACADTMTTPAGPGACSCGHAGCATRN